LTGFCTSGVWGWYNAGFAVLDGWFGVGVCARVCGLQFGCFVFCDLLLVLIVFGVLLFVIFNVSCGFSVGFVARWNLWCLTI